MSEWHDINTAPRDGSPVWARGWDFGNEELNHHYGWVFWIEGRWQWAHTEDFHEATHISEWLDVFKQPK